MELPIAQTISTSSARTALMIVSCAFSITRSRETRKGTSTDDTSRLKAARSFIIAFELACEECGFRDRVKVSSIGWQGGTHAETLGHATQEV